MKVSGEGMNNLVVSLLPNNSNVLVVLESFAELKKAFTSLEDYLKENNLEFIYFKRDTMLKVTHREDRTSTVMLVAKDSLVRGMTWQLSAAVVTCELNQEQDNLVRSRLRCCDDNPSGYIDLREGV